MTMRRAWWFLASMSLASAAAGQPAPAAQPAPAPGAPQAPAPGAVAAPAPPAEPKLPTVDDPMLQPPPPARRTLKTWQEAVAMVRQNSSSLRTSAARVFQAEARARQALALALPQLTGTANVTHHLLRGEGTEFVPDADVMNGESPFRSTTIPDPATTWNAGLGLRVPVFAPQAWYDHGTAKRERELAKLDTKELERQALGAVANAIVSVVTAERLAEVSRVSLQSALSTLDLNTRRAALGASSALDVLRVEQEVQLARAQLVSADESLIRAREALGLALGTSDNFGVPPDIKLDQLASDARGSCRRDPNIANRPDLRASAYNIELAERRKKGVDWSFWPTVDAVSNLTYWSNQDATPNGDHWTWTVGGVLTWELYDGGLRYAQRQVNEADIRIAREQYTEARRQAEIEVEQATRGIAVSEQNLAVSARAREIAAETARLAKVAYLNGSGTSFDLVDTARRLREAELDLAIKEFEVMRARIAALLALASCNV